MRRLFVLLLIILTALTFLKPEIVEALEKDDYALIVDEKTGLTNYRLTWGAFFNIITLAQTQTILTEAEKGNRIVLYTNKKWITRDYVGIKIYWKDESGKYIKELPIMIPFNVIDEYATYKKVAIIGFPITSVLSIILLIIIFF